MVLQDIIVDIHALKEDLEMYVNWCVTVVAKPLFYQRD